MSPLPAAAKRALIAKGAMDHQGVTRKPRARHCRRCRRAVLAAITDIGVTSACQPTPTTLAGELEALMAGLYTVLHLNDAFIYRDARIIKRYPPDLYDVLVVHSCDVPPPPMNPKRIKPPPKRKEDDNADPPF